MESIGKAVWFVVSTILWVAFVLIVIRGLEAIPGLVRNTIDKIKTNREFNKIVSKEKA